MIKKFAIYSILAIALQSCQFMNVQAEQGLTFKTLENWQLLGQENPELLKVFVKDNQVDLTETNPQRFGYQSAQGLYFIDPPIDCPVTGCPDLSGGDFDMKQYYRPYCNDWDACRRYVYVKDGKGSYREAWASPIWLKDGFEDRIIIRVSEQMQNNLPLCFELAARDFSERNQYSDIDANQERFITRYCQEGKSYTVNKIYKVPFKNVKTRYPDFSKN